ncbi:unnamed protein product [Tilletia controversa]|nr:unnamed protein product [Tilletia controversa]
MSESDLFQPLAQHDYERMVLLTCLSSAESGVWLWELAYGIRFDWMLLTGQHSVRPSMVFYLLLRIVYTCQVFASFAFLANTKNLDCTLVLSILSVSIYVSGFAASSIFASRALSAWRKSRLIAAVLCVLVLGQFGVLISNITSLRGNMLYVPYVGWRCIGVGDWWSGIFRQAAYNAAYDIFLAIMTLFRLRKNAKDVQLLNVVVRDVKILGGLAIFPTGVMLIVYVITQSDVVGSVSLPTAVLIRAIIASRSYQQVFRMGQTADFKERRILSKIANGEILDADALRGSFLPMRTLRKEAAPVEQAREARTNKFERDSATPLSQDVESQQPAQQPALQVVFDDDSASEYPRPPSDHSDSIASTRRGKATASTIPTRTSSQGSTGSMKEGETPSRMRILASTGSAIVSNPSTPTRLVPGDPSGQQRPHVQSGASISFTEATQRLKKK